MRWRLQGWMDRFVRRPEETERLLETIRDSSRDQTRAARAAANAIGGSIERSKDDLAETMAAAGERTVEAIDTSTSEVSSAIRRSTLPRWLQTLGVVAALTAAWIGYLAWQADSPVDDASPTNSQQPTTSLRAIATRVSTERIRQLDGVEGVDIDISYPVVHDAPAADEINRSIAGVVDSITGDARELDGTPWDAGVEMDYELLTISGNLLSLKLHQSWWSASQGDLVWGLTVDLTNGRRYGLRQLMDPAAPWETAISEMVCAEVRGMTPEDVECDPSRALSDPATLGVKKDHVVLMFSECELTHCLLDQIEISIPLVDIESLLDPNGPLALP